MRIITGIAKGRKILAPEGMDTRPTSDRVKESVFNMISRKIYGAKVLDMFSGTGNLGLESLSRGAESCTFIEKNKSTYKILLDNINNLGFKEKSEVYNSDAFDILEKIGRNAARYDIIFLDPPYSKGLVEKAILIIGETDLLSSDGVIISEYDENDIIPHTINDIKAYRTQKYGRTKISFWNKESKNG